VEVKPTEGQIDDLLQQIRERIDRSERILVTTLTKRMAEELADYLSEMGIRNTYLHSDIQTLDRIEILRDLRMGVYDVIVGINLLREGLDLPEVSLVAILDADKEGYLRSETSMVQTIGRAARHSNGHVIMYADRKTDSMQKAIDETNRRRTIQADHNKTHGIEPTSIQKEVHDITEGIKAIAESRNRYNVVRKEMSRTEMFKVVKDLEVQMKESAKSLQFEKAAQFRDEIFELRRLLALEEKIIGPGDLMPEDTAAALEEELA
jgi:excinuclease ABC subunit B